MSVTLEHPANAIGRKEMPFVRNTRLVPSNVVLDRGSGSPTTGRGDWGIETPFKMCIANRGHTVRDSGMITIDGL